MSSTNFVGQRVVAQVRKSLAQKILSAPIDALERYRTHRLMPVLSQDVDMISDVAFALSVDADRAASRRSGCLAYLAYAVAAAVRRAVGGAGDRRDGAGHGAVPRA